MHYEEFAPPETLAAHVHCIWSFECVEKGARQAVPPDGRCELIVHCGRHYQERHADGTWRTQPRAIFAGQLTRPLVLRSRGAERERFPQSLNDLPVLLPTGHSALRPTLDRWFETQALRPAS